MQVITFPQVSPPIAAATVIRWLKQPGDSIVAGEALLVLEGEEFSVQIEATSCGKLAEITAKPGQTIRVGDPLGQIASQPALPPSGATAKPSRAPKETSVTKSVPAAAGKVTPILMPQAGNTMEEGTVISWRVKPGDQITVGQILCEIETDKATMDFESPDAGRLARIVAREGEPVAVKGLIALLAESDADADAFLAGTGKSTTFTKSSPAASVSTVPAIGAASTTAKRSRAPAPVTAAGRVKASPAARRIAAERGIDTAAVGSGSGPGGRILSYDLDGTTTANTAVVSVSGTETRRPLSKMRRAVGLNLQQSKQTVPHFYVRTTIDADPLLAFYRAQKNTANCSLNDIVILAVGRTIREFPAVRSQIVGNEIVEYPHANIGIAVGVDEGLVVPVVTNVDSLSLANLAAESKRVVELARKGRLENIGKGHFTISNLGMFGVEEFSAIINPPESGILAVSAAREAVIVENGAMRAGHSMAMTLSADHRVIDGVMAAKFMQRLREFLEHPTDTLS